MTKHVNGTITVQGSKPQQQRQNQGKGKGRGSSTTKVEIDIRGAGAQRSSRPSKGRGTARGPKQGVGATQRSAGGPMVPLPSDTHSVIGSATPQRIALDNIKSQVVQQIDPNRAQAIVRSPSVQNWKSHASKFSTVQAYAFSVGKDEMVARAVSTPEMLEVASPETVLGSSVTFQGIASSVGARGEYTQWLNDAPEGKVRTHTDPNTGKMGISIVGATVAPLSTMTVEEGQTPSGIDYILTDGSTGTATPSAGVFTFPLDVIFISLFYENSDVVSTTFDLDFISFPAYTFFTSTPVALPASTQTLKCAFLSFLASYSGSTLNDAGQIVMALTDPGWYPDGDNVFESLSRLPDRRYSGVLKKGAYGWWIPMNLNEGNPQPITYWDRKPERSALWCAVKGAQQTASMKLEVTLGLEFYAPEQIYAHVPSPMRAPIHDYLAALYQHLPHCFENDSHDETNSGLIKRAHQSIMRAVKDPVSLGLGVLALA